LSSFFVFRKVSPVIANKVKPSTTCVHVMMVYSISFGRTDRPKYFSFILQPIWL